jgi:hypothetical protein
LTNTETLFLEETCFARIVHHYPEKTRGFDFHLAFHHSGLTKEANNPCWRGIVKVEIISERVVGKLNIKNGNFRGLSGSCPGVSQEVHDSCKHSFPHGRTGFFGGALPRVTGFSSGGLSGNDDLSQKEWCF